MSAFRVYKHYFLATGDAVDADATGYAGISPSVNADAPKKCGNAGLHCRIIIKRESLLQVFLFIALGYNSLASVYYEDTATVNALHLLAKDIVNRLDA